MYFSKRTSQNTHFSRNEPGTAMTMAKCLRKFPYEQMSFWVKMTFLLISVKRLRTGMNAEDKRQTHMQSRDWSYCVSNKNVSVNVQVSAKGKYERMCGKVARTAVCKATHNYFVYS